MDVFDEFEMKPLTEGLGFHAKDLNAKSKVELSKNTSKPIENSVSVTQRKSVDRATEALDKLMSSLNTLDKKGITFTETLPVTAEGTDKVNKEQVQALKKQPNIHPSVPETPSLPKIDNPVVESLKEDVKKIVSEDSAVVAANIAAGTRRGASDSFMGKLKATAISIPAAILDSIVIFAISILFVMGLLMATEVSINTLLASVSADLMTQVSAFMLYIVVLQVYVVLSRSFFGCTLGEWTFDCQMGTDTQLENSYYPMQVVWRSLIVIGTGLIILPILSLLSRRDLSSYLTGLQLYKKA